ncbi:MAG: hypothetical protein KF773_35445 [Deltaproteobacteria bacterium]|nr:hypothetical protein [Deltaproteobacteria bacterium]MCW5806994.1 hypothetical protein [Deltaproteobacteria bacterium]
MLEGDDVEVGPTSLAVPIATHGDITAARADDLVAGVQGGGYVRRIVGVELANDVATLATEDITLGEAVGDADVTNSLADGKADGSTSLSFNFSTGRIALYERPGISIGIANAALTFRPRLDVDLRFARFELDHFLVDAHGLLTGDLALDVRANGAGAWHVERPTWRDTHTFVQWFGWVPVVETVELVVGVGADVNSTATATATVGGGFTASIDAGVEYKNGAWRPIAAADMQVRGTPPNVTTAGAVDVDAYVYAELRIRMYGAAGPFVKVMPGVRLHGDPATTRRTVGLRGTGGAELANPFGDNLRYETKLFDVASRPF